MISLLKCQARMNRQSGPDIFVALLERDVFSQGLDFGEEVDLVDERAGDGPGQRAA